MCVTPDESKKNETETLKTNEMNAFESGNENMFCLIDGNRGIYIPQFFAQSWGEAVQSGMDEEQKNVLLDGPDCEDYFDTWSEIVDDVVFVFDGIECTLYEDNDLWAVPVN